MTLARIKYAAILHLKRIKQGKLPTIRLSPVTSECKKGGDNDNLNVKKTQRWNSHIWHWQHTYVTKRFRLSSTLALPSLSSLVNISISNIVCNQNKFIREFTNIFHPYMKRRTIANNTFFYILCLSAHWCGFPSWLPRPS